MRSMNLAMKTVKLLVLGIIIDTNGGLVEGKWVKHLPVQRVSYFGS